MSTILSFTNYLMSAHASISWVSKSFLQPILSILALKASLIPTLLCILHYKINTSQKQEIGRWQQLLTVLGKLYISTELKTVTRANMLQTKIQKKSNKKKSTYHSTQKTACMPKSNYRSSYTLDFPTLSNPSVSR